MVFLHIRPWLFHQTNACILRCIHENPIYALNSIVDNGQISRVLLIRPRTHTHTHIYIYIQKKCLCCQWIYMHTNIHKLYHIVSFTRAIVFSRLNRMTKIASLWDTFVINFRIALFAWGGLVLYCAIPKCYFSVSHGSMGSLDCLMVVKNGLKWVAQTRHTVQLISRPFWKTDMHAEPRDTTKERPGVAQFSFKPVTNCYIPIVQYGTSVTELCNSF